MTDKSDVDLKTADLKTAGRDEKLLGKRRISIISTEYLKYTL